MSDRVRKFIERYRGAKIITDAQPLAPDFETKVGSFKEYYGTNYNRLRAAEKTCRNLVQLLLSEIPIEEPKIDSRVNDRNECIRKFELKYRDELERTAQDYNIQDHISDLIGIRIICLYETDIAFVERVVAENFRVIATTNKTKSLIDQVDSFGYKGLHIDVRLSDDRLHLPEYRSFGDLRFEIQIRSIVQDAWSEVDHKLKYKRQIPDTLKRRIVRLAAIFELADQEFVAIKNETEKLEASVSAASPEEAQELSADELDSFSFLSIMKSRYPSYRFDPIRIDGFVDELKRMRSDLTLSELRAAVDRHSDVVREYRAFTWSMGFGFNPFTEIRHILYLHNPNIFDRMLYPLQRDKFLEWMSENAERADGEAAPAAE
jgi:putative GTP pyrophosphokinase